MARPITLKIDVTRINKEHLYKGAKGTYLNVVLFPNKDGRGQFGDTHFAAQEVSKEAREAGVKGPIIGNATFPDDEGAPRGTAPYNHSKPVKDPAVQPDADDSLPF